MEWKEIPDILAVGMLIYAFMAVSRRGDNPTSRVWLAAWIMIEIHFFAALFLHQAAGFGELAILMAVIGFLMLVASVFKTGYEGQLRSVGGLLLAAGIVLYVILVVLA